MQHLLAYTITNAGASTDADMSAFVDPEFSQRSSHYLLTEQYRLVAACALGATPTRVNIQIPSYNAVGRWNIWPLTKGATVPSPPQFAWYDRYPSLLPLEEELTVKWTGTAAETDTVFLWLGTEPYTTNLPQGAEAQPGLGTLMIPIRVTASPTIVAGAWSASAALTFEQSLKGGAYAVVGAQWQGTALSAVRIIFPRNALYRTRRLRPGWLAQQAIGDLEEVRHQINPFVWGEVGRFHTVELPQIEVAGSTAGAVTVEGRLWLIYLGKSQDLLNNFRP